MWRIAVVLALMAAGLGLSVAWAAQPVTPTPKSETPPAPPTPTATPLLDEQAGPPGATPPPPPPPTATPLLPEEGGPPGGVIGGFLYSDDDADGVRSPGDRLLVGSQVFVDILDTENRIIEDHFIIDTLVAYADETGFWQMRALKEGRYRVRWEPPVPDEFIVWANPALESVVLSPGRTGYPADTRFAAVRVIEVRADSRVLNIDFGIRARPAVAGVPSAGTGGGTNSQAVSFVLVGALATSIAAGLLTALLRRRTRGPARPPS